MKIGIVRFVLLIVLAGFSLSSLSQDSKKPIYVPPADVVTKMTEEQAKQTVENILVKHAGITGAIIAGREVHLSDNLFARAVIFDEERLVIKLGKWSEPDKGILKELEVRYETMPQAEVVSDSVALLTQFGVPVSANDVVWVVDSDIGSDNRKAVAEKLADALEVIRVAGIESSRSTRNFDQVVAQYRALNPKPALPEAARRATVQAKLAVEQKRYADAIRFYGEGLAEVPWWANGRYNHAVLLGEVGRYRQAIGEMKRYLMLAPDAPDARDAQDRIYRWDAEDRLGPPPSAKVDEGPRGGVLATTRNDGCFIATAAYGSDMDPHVVELRAFRDSYLLTNAPGRYFVAQYYRYSPPIAHGIAQDENLRTAVRWMLWPLVFVVAEPYAVLVVLLCTGVAILLFSRRNRSRLHRTVA